MPSLERLTPPIGNLSKLNPTAATTTKRRISPISSRDARSRYRSPSPKKSRRRRRHRSQSGQRVYRTSHPRSRSRRSQSRGDRYRVYSSQSSSSAGSRGLSTDSTVNTYSSRAGHTHYRDHKKSRSYQPRRGRRDRSVMERFIDAISSHHEHGALVGAQDVIPKFDPCQKSQTTRSWLKKVNETASIYKWSERQTIFYALPKLSGLARRWYEGLSSVKLTWRDWQKKLLKSFPDDRNYADRLTEMLDRKSRKEESLEEYFYDKAKLINHCRIKGKEAVDCIIHGIFDHNIRLNAQGANFKSPSKLLRYLRNITVKTNNFKKGTPFKSSTAPVGKTGEASKIHRPVNTPRTVRCYNCSEPGHTVPRCPKELQKCSKCSRIGHIAAHCKRGQDVNDPKTNNLSTHNQTTNATNKVQRITAQEATTDIYIKNIKLNGTQKVAFVDFGSQCSIIKLSIAKEMQLVLDSTDLPVMKGFALGVIQPMGRVYIDVSLDFVKVRIEAYVVPDEFLNTDILIGQNLTELPNVVVYKTHTSLVLYADTPEMNKTEVYCTTDTKFKGMCPISVRCGTNYTGYIYIPGNSSFKTGEEIIILQGVYYLKESLGHIVAINFSGGEVMLEANKLIARARLLPVENNFAVPKPPAEFEVNIVNRDNDGIHVTKSKITIDMLNIGPDVTDSQKQDLLDLVNEYRNCFALNTNELGTTSISEMHIKILDDTPVSYKPYRLPYSERLIVRDLVSELLENKIIQESNSAYASPIVLVKKKNNDYRLCVDYRALNKKTIKESYPMPVIDDQLDRLNGKKYFTSLDLKSGYHQIPIATDSRHLTAFITPDGHYEYTRMPFGLVNAPAVFQHMINKALGKDRYDLAIPYMDDLLSPTTTIEEGLAKLRRIFASLLKAGLTLNIEKCHFFEASLDYLGFEVSPEGLKPGLRKTEAVALFPTPASVHQVRQFIGLASFFRRFVPNFASIAKPLTSLTKTNTPWVWGAEQDKAFNTIKSKLVERPLLALYDPTYTTEVHCDASKLGVGGILLQRPDERSPLKPVAYFSKQTTKEEEFMHSYELETLAVVLSLKKFRTYLIGIPFKVYTDCNALRSTLTKRDIVPRIARWWLLLQEYNFTIEYRPGDNMKHVDALSRNPLPNTDYDSLADMREFEIMNVTATEWLQTVQMTDPKLKCIKAVLESDPKDVQDVLDNYTIRDSKIYRRVDGKLKWVVPNGARWRICQLNHDEAGHFAFDKTLDKIKQDYWFPKMSRFVRKYVSACLNCALNKSSTSKRTGYLHPIPKGNTPFHTLHMDHLGPFVRSKNGNSYILGIIDGFSKFIFLKTVKNLKSKTTVKVLQDIFDTIGVPKVIISDRGTSFTAATFKKYVQSIGAKHILNAVATPRANGQIERYNRTILESLAASNNDLDERDWDTHVGKVQWSLNNTINKTLGMTPSEIVFGHRTINSKEGQILNEIQESGDDVYLNREKIREIAKQKNEKNQNLMKAQFDSTRAPTKFFDVDDLVMIPNHNLPADGKSKKLRPKFRGPYKVTAVLKNDRYEISSIEGYSKRKYKSVYPADQLKKWITFNTTNETDNEDDSSSDSNKDRDVQQGEDEAML